MAKIFQTKLASRLRKASVIFTSSVCFCVAAASSQPLSAQNQEFEFGQQEPEVVEGPEAEKKVQEELQNLEDLEISQRKARARQLIAKYPKTEAAKIVRRLLRELELYDEAKAAERAQAEARKVLIREYWRKEIAQTLTIPNYRELPLVRIGNESDQVVLFQLRGYGMGWTRPVFLSSGETIEVNYPVTYRQFTSAGMEMYSLAAGNEYLFRQSKPGELPQLFHTGPEMK